MYIIVNNIQHFHSSHSKYFKSFPFKYNKNTLLLELPVRKPIYKFFVFYHQYFISIKCFKTKQADYGGEDAFYVSDMGGGTFGVADGVGSWNEAGINPGGKRL